MVLGATSTRLFLACLLLVTTFILSGRAQSLNASLSGTVTDPSGSVLPTPNSC